MAQIEDVSPTWSNTQSPTYSVNGRMLSLACSQDGKVVFAGSLSNDVWASEDGGRTWDQVNWPQPDPDQFDVPGSMGGYSVVDVAVSPEAGRWRVDRDLRLLGDIRGIGRDDIVGFGDTGVWTALSNGDGTFQAPRVVLAAFGRDAGQWRVDRHPRFLAVLTNSGYADIVGFGDDGVWTALSNGDGTFQDSKFVLADFGYQAGNWRVEKHPRFLAVLTKSGFVDIVGFGDIGVYVALSDGLGGFRAPDPQLQPPQVVLADFGYQAGNWRVEKHPRFLADLTGNGIADIVGFGDAGVYVALGDGNGGFKAPDPQLQPPQLVLADFGYEAGQWRVEKHPRFLAVLTDSRCADIVGFGDAGVYVALSDGNGGFKAPDPQLQPPQVVLADFGYEAGAWRVEKHPRFLADITGNGWADIVGFGDIGVYVALSDGNGGFKAPDPQLQPPQVVLGAFGYEAGGWRVERHPRLLGEIRGIRRADIVAFGDAGVWTALSDGNGGFQDPGFVLANFGYQLTVLAITRSNRESADAGIWRSSDGGQNWTQVHQFPGSAPPAGQLVWPQGSGHLVYAAGGSALAVSRDGGATFQNVLRVPPIIFERFEPINHVAVAPVPPGALNPPVVYALREQAMFLSFDGGSHWKRDPQFSFKDVGGPVDVALSQAASVMVVSPRSPFEVFVAGNGFVDAYFPTLWRGQYSMTLGGLRSRWAQVRVPDSQFQDSGNAFLAATQPGRGDLLFLGQQRATDPNLGNQRPLAYVGPVASTSASEWRALDDSGHLHVDLHGMLLSPDFEATLHNGAYHAKAGTLWMLSDGGIHWSTDGGQNFQAASDVKTLSCVNVAGVAIQGHGPVLSLNTGDNDGLFSSNGGVNWTAQDYGGGDNDCSYADPLRPHSMLVFTPRWDTQGKNVPASMGQTVTIYDNPAGLPDAGAGTNQRHIVPGPPLGTTSGPDVWNAVSDYGIRGFRPIVLNVGPDDAFVPDEYIFVRWKSDAEAVVLRTQQIRAIGSRSDWDTSAMGPGPGVRVFQQGQALPDPHLAVVQAAGGHITTVFYAGNAGIPLFSRTPENQLWVLRFGASDWEKLVPGGGAADAFRFFVDPYRGGVVYLVDSKQQNVMRSDDGGQTWQVDQNLQTQLTRGGRIPIARGDDVLDVVLTDMQFDPNASERRFAVGLGGVFMTNDGVQWSTLLDARALPGRPTNCYFDWISIPSAPALYVAFGGRSLVKISPLP